jgi:hypothetical protein
MAKIRFHEKLLSGMILYHDSRKTVMNQAGRGWNAGRKAYDRAQAGQGRRESSSSEYDIAVVLEALHLLPGDGGNLVVIPMIIVPPVAIGPSPSMLPVYTIKGARNISWSVDGNDFPKGSHS